MAKGLNNINLNKATPMTKAATKKKEIAEMKEIVCIHCGMSFAPKFFFSSSGSTIWNYTNGKPTICKSCIDIIYKRNLERYGSERAALIGICAMLDLPFVPQVYKELMTNNNKIDVSAYIRRMATIHYSTLSFINSVVKDDLSTSEEQEQFVRETRWNASDRNNRDQVISLIGFDPFEGHSNNDRKKLFADIIKYFDDDIAEDPYKLSQIMQIVKNNLQIDKYDIAISSMNISKDREEIAKLSSMKKDLVSSNDKIAKENEISVKNRSNKDIGKSTLTYLMRDLREKNFKDAEANYYNQLKSEGTLWAVDMSNKAILQNAMFDENDKQEILEYQRKMIQDLQSKLDDELEKNRLLEIDNEKLRNDGDV